jgi:3-oxoacyl-[acyl-carrier protein] reductase
VSENQPLTGKAALVTGSARGIGRAYARRLAQMGAAVMVSDIDLESGAEYGGPDSAPVVSELEALGADAAAFRCDVTVRAEVDALMAAVVRAFGRLDVLVCNAGGLFEDLTTSYATLLRADDLTRTLERNLYGTMFCCQSATPLLTQNGWGKVVTVSSTGAVRSAAGGWYAGYGAAKAAVAAYTIYLAEELGQYNVTVNAIAPGFIRTPRIEARIQSNEADRAVAQAACLRRWGTVEDCAGAIEFLCSPLSDFVTGQVIYVDGGVTVRDPAWSPAGG